MMFVISTLTLFVFHCLVLFNTVMMMIFVTHCDTFHDQLMQKTSNTKVLSTDVTCAAASVRPHSALEPALTESPNSGKLEFLAL